MSTLAQMKARLSPAESAFYEFLWTHYLKHKAWPSTWHVYRNHLEKPKLVRVLNASRYQLYSENTSQHPRTYELSPAGVLVTGKAETYRRRLAEFFAYLRDRFYAGEDTQCVVSQGEAAKVLKLSEQEADEFGLVLRTGFHGINPVWQPGSPGWQLFLPLHLIEEFPRHGPLKRELDALLEQLSAQAKKSPRTRLAPHALKSTAALSGLFAEPSDLARRYQVFVSSPFEDLKDERKLVVQALLEMQCFPAGMEIFPAASMEQLKLIERMIDESDYYILIIAARYGTLVPGTKISYTEREFLYARRVGKPILVFYHSSPGKVAVEKAEPNPAGRKRLQKFTAKLKTPGVQALEQSRGLAERCEVSPAAGV